MIRKIGLIGCGAVAGYGHLPAIRDVKDLELFALYDPNKETLAAAEAKFEVRHAFSEIEPFLHCGIEAVTITSPAPAHKQNVLDAARHNLGPV